MPLCLTYARTLCAQATVRAFDVHRSDILRAEWELMCELDFELATAQTRVLPHFSRLLQQLELLPQGYLGEEQYASVFGIDLLLDQGLGDADLLAEAVAEDVAAETEAEAEAEAVALLQDSAERAEEQRGDSEVRVQVERDSEVLIEVDA